MIFIQKKSSQVINNRLPSPTSEHNTIDKRLIIIISGSIKKFISTIRHSILPTPKAMPY